VTAFLLSKWYGDCVSPEGDAFIGYWASLAWGALRVPYAASLLKPAGETSLERRALRAGPPPAFNERRLEWRCPALGLRCSWQPSVPSVRRVLFDGAAGRIAWSCAVPAGLASIDLAGGRPLAGSGYAEHLTMSVVPWRLPFDELRWGRFISPHDAVTWIEWRGDAPRRWVFYNGLNVELATVGDRRLSLDGVGQVDLSEPVTLRDGALTATVLRWLPGGGRWLLPGMEQARETKWLAAGTFRSAARSSPGWAIHEAVRLR
jgi:hypothetical protein